MPRTAHGQAFHTPALISPTICVNLVTNRPAVSLGNIRKAPAPIKFAAAAPSRSEAFHPCGTCCRKYTIVETAPIPRAPPACYEGRDGYSNASVGHEATRHCSAEAGIGGNVGLGASSNFGRAIFPSVRGKNSPRFVLAAGQLTQPGGTNFSTLPADLAGNQCRSFDPAR